MYLMMAFEATYLMHQPFSFPVVAVKQHNKEVIEIPVPSLAKTVKEKEKKATWTEFDLEMICCLSSGNN